MAEKPIITKAEIVAELRDVFARSRDLERDAREAGREKIAAGHLRIQHRVMKMLKRANVPGAWDDSLGEPAPLPPRKPRKTLTDKLRDLEERAAKEKRGAPARKKQR